MKKLLHYAFVLIVICAVTTLGVAGTYRLTRERIRGRELQERISAQSRVIRTNGAADVKFEAVDPNAIAEAQVMKALDASSGEVLGYAALGGAQGYGGRINVMVGMDPRAERIVGVAIVPPLNETPGLGTRVAEVKSSRTWFSILTGKTPEGPDETVPAFMKQFLGRTPDQTGLDTGDGKGVHAVTGATISSRAVTNAVWDGATKIQKALGVAVIDGTTGASPTTELP